jgi:capsular polysaccharide biosynthesis protein
MTNFFDNQNLLETLWKWKKHLIVVGILAIVFSAIFSSSFFIKPKYKSTTRIYPSNNIYTFSDESESEQLLEIISAQDIKLRVIEAFNLSKVYKISKQEPQYLTSMMGEFNDNVSFKKTEYETIEIQVLDTDPVRASAMCDSIVSFLDEKVRSMHRLKYKEVVEIAKKDLALRDHEIDSVIERLNFLRKEYKILDYAAQAKEITKGLVYAMNHQQKNTAGGGELDQWMNDLTKYGGEFEYLKNQQIYMLTQKADLKKIYDEAVSNANKKIVYGQRVQKPIPADKKSYPLRSLIVIVSTLSAIFAAMLIILFLENKKYV